MSAITGIVNFDHAPVDRDLLRRMSAAGADRGPDASGEWVEGSLGFAYRGLWTTLEDGGQEQPLQDRHTGLVILFDGRVDARAELRAACSAAGHPAYTSEDAELVLRAHQVWGEACPKHILGDYAFAIWDPRYRRLFCARDSSGIRPLFYSFAGKGSFRFATGANQLLADPGLPRTVDPLGILDRLYGEGALEPERTPLASIRWLPAAHTLVVDSDGIRVRRYWSLEDVPSQKLGSQEEYAEACSEALQAALRDRLRGCDPVGISLSGGWDSGALFTLWQWMRSRSESLPPPRAFTYYYDYPESDERDDAVFTHVDADHALQGLGEHVVQLGVPERKFVWRAARQQARAVRQSGIRTLITGDGGDFLFLSSPLRPVDLLREGRARAAYDQLRLWAEEAGGPTHEFLWPNLLRPALPILWPRLWKMARRVRSLLWNNSALPYLTPAFQSTLSNWSRAHADEYRRPGQGKPLAAWDKQARLDRLFKMSFPLSTGPDLEGLGQSVPYLDRRVIGTALAALSSEEAPVSSRSLLGKVLEQTAGDRLPGNWAVIDQAMEDGLRGNLRTGNPLFRASTLVELGIVDRDRLGTFLEEYTCGRSDYSDEVWRLAAAEAWASRWLTNETSNGRFSRRSGIMP